MKRNKLLCQVFTTITMFSVMTMLSNGSALAAENPSIIDGNLSVIEEEMPNIPKGVQNHIADEAKQVETTSNDEITETDEKAILKMISAYERKRSTDVEQLETQIDNYFMTQYGMARSFYVVEFKSAGNGTLKDRTVYVLMGDDDTKYLNDAVGGFVAPTTVPKSGYAFDYWNRMNITEEIVSEALGDMPITSATVFYANFATDKNADGIPDRKQEQYTVKFITDSTYGTLYGKTDFTVYAPIDGSPAYLICAPEYSLPNYEPANGYAFDKWIDADGEIENIQEYIVTKDVTITAIFAKDTNLDGIPDYKQRFHKVIFTAGSGGQIEGNTMQFFVLARDDGEPNYLVNSYYYNNYPERAVPDDGYMFRYWIDHMGNIISYEAYTKDLLHVYDVTGESVIVAVFAEDRNHDNIPDDEQEFFQVNFVSGMGGMIDGNTSKEYATAGEGKYPTLSDLDMRDFKVIANEKYIFSYWIDHKGNVYDTSEDWYQKYEVKEDTVFVAVFAEDFDENGIPDDKQGVSSIPNGNYRAEGFITFDMRGIMNNIQEDIEVQNCNLEVTDDELILTFQSSKYGDFIIKLKVYTDEAGIMYFSKLECNEVEYDFGNQRSPFQNDYGHIVSYEINVGDFYMNFGLSFTKL